MNPYVVYILRCADGTFYTGITTDLVRRLREHNTSAKGAKYTKARLPVALVYQESAGTRSDAQKREHILRTLPRKTKIDLIEAGSSRMDT